MLCATLALGGIWVPETGRSVQAAEPTETSVEMTVQGTETAGISVQEVEPTVEAEEIYAEDPAEEYDSSWDAADTDSVSGNAVTAVSLDGAEDDIASGTYENITWRIDANGKLTVEGTGEFSASEGADRVPWYNERRAVKSAEIRVSGLRDASYLFDGFVNLESVDLSGFNTSSVTNMSSMFSNCSSLASVDLSGFDTSNVTDMNRMFYNCYCLTSVDVSGFDTGSVTDLSGMFYKCYGLTSVDVSGFNTSNVTDMGNMFNCCFALTSVDVSRFDTSRVTDMNHMFYYCGKLTNLDVSGFDTKNVTSMGSMFGDCGGLTNLDVSGFDISSVTDMSYLFSNCSGLTSVDMSGLNAGSVTNMSQMFGNCSGLTSVNLSGLDAGSVTDMRDLFEDCDNLESVDMSEVNASSLTRMNGMFRYRKNLTSVNLSGFNASSVTDLSGMFSYCKNLTSVDMRGFNASSVRDMGAMFSGCSNLTSVDMSGLIASSVTDMSGMFLGCSSLTSLDVSMFDTSNVTDMRKMFSDCSGLTSLDVSMFDTGSVMNMSSMFSGCSGLTSVDVSGLDTGSVMNMSSMFSGCSGLTSLDVSMFDTSSVTDMRQMFGNCSGLTSLDVSGLDTSNVTDMCSMFSECSGLTSLDVSVLDTGSVKDMSWMFSKCSGLTSVDVSGLDTSRVTSMSRVFYGCSSLTSLDVSGFNTSNVTDMTYMFSDCSGLTSVDLSGIDTSSVTSMSWMFSNCNGLTSLDVSGFNTSSVTDMTFMFNGCSNLTSLNVSGFDTGSVTDMTCMFCDCSNLTSLDVSGFNTSNVTSMYGMFSGCSGLKSVDVSRFDTSHVTNMSGMFEGCSGLTSVDVSGFDTSRVASIGGMFRRCKGLKSVDLNGLDMSSMTDLSYLFSGCSGLTSLDLSGFDTSYVSNMSHMFYNCSNLTSVDVSGFDTSHVSDMSEMFRGCYKLESLDLSGFDMSNVWDIGEKFFSNGSDMGLTMIYTPYNIFHVTIELPIESGKWYDSAGTRYDSLPEGLDHSIVLMRDTKPDAAMSSRLTVRLAKFFYEPGGVVNPEDLIVKYRGTDGKTVTLSRKSDDAAGYTMSDVDMSTPGVKTLTVSYNDGTDTLTGSVTFTVFAYLTDSMVTLPEGEYVYNGKAHEPVPIVKSADGKTLICGKDYEVSYTGNIDAGEGTLSVTGRNAYGGTVTKNFTVQRATLADIEISFWELCEEKEHLRLHRREISGYFNGETAPNNGGITYTIGEITEHDSVDAGNVLSDAPEIYKENWTYLIYTTNTGTAGDTVSISVIATFGMNYKDAVIHVTIGLKEKRDVSISGITMKKKNIYNGKPVAPKGTATVRAEDQWETNVTDLVTLLFHYTGTQSDGTAYDSDTAPTRPGSYILRVTVAGNDLYEGSAEYPFVISKVPLIVTASDVTLEIGTFDTLPDEGALSYEITGFLGTHTAQEVLSAMPVVSYGLNGKKINKASVAVDKAGSYELIPSGAVLNQAFGEEYEITERSYRKGRLTIAESGSGGSTDPDDPTNPDDPENPDDPKDSEIPDDGKFRVNAVSDQTYTGSAIKPAVKVYYGSRRLTEKTDYTVTYKNNTKVNNGKTEQTAPTVTVTGKGNYSGKQIITFAITPKDITEEDVTAAELIAPQNSKVQKPVPSLTYQGKKLKNKTDFTVSYPDENKPGAYQNAGTYTVTVTGTGNYTGTKNLTYTITDKTLLSKAKVTVKAKDYTGSEVTLNAEDITVKVGKATLAYGTDYTLSYRNNTQTGNATVIVTGTGDIYAGSKEAVFRIKGESLAKAQITGVVDKTYTGAAQTQDLQVQLNGKTLREGEDYTVSYAKAVNAGTATVTVTGKGGYTGTAKKSFKITAYDLQTNEGGRLQGVPQNFTTAYTKGGATPALMLTFDGKLLVAKKDYTVAYKNNKKPASASDARVPVMVIKGKGNFKGTLTIPFSITVSNLATDGRVSITAADTAYVDKAGKYMAKPVLTDANGKKLTAGTDYEKTFTYALVNDDGTEKALTAADTVPEGSEVKVTVTGKGNYTGTLSATYRITKTSFAKAKITVTPQAYTGGAVTLDTKDIKVELNGNTLIYGTDYTIVPGSYRNNTKRGTATVIVKGLGDYGGMRTVKFKITAKPLAAFKLFP